MNNNLKNTLVIIPARGGSKRIVEKNIKIIIIFGNNFFTLQNEFRLVKKNYNLLADFGYVNNYNSNNNFMNL